MFCIYGAHSIENIFTFKVSFSYHNHKVARADRLSLPLYIKRRGSVTVKNWPLAQHSEWWRRAGPPALQPHGLPHYLAQSKQSIPKLEYMSEFVSEYELICLREKTLLS